MKANFTLYEETIDGLPGYRVTGLSNGLTARVLKNGTAYQFAMVAAEGQQGDWSEPCATFEDALAAIDRKSQPILAFFTIVAAELLRRVSDNLQDQGGIPETMIPIGERYSADGGTVIAKNPTGKAALRLRWLWLTSNQYALSVEIWPKGIAKPIVADRRVPNDDLKLTIEQFSKRYLWHAASVIANCIVAAREGVVAK